MSTPTSIICRVVFMPIATRKKERVRPWPSINGRWSSTLLSRWLGQVWLRRMCGLRLFHRTRTGGLRAARGWLAFNLAVTGRFDAARAEYPRVVELNPAAPWSHAGLGFAFLVKGKFEEAAVAAQDDAAEFARLLVVAMARWGQKRIPEADAALTRLTDGFADTAAYQIA